MKTAIYLRKSRAEEITDTAEETLLKHRETLLKFAVQNNLDIVAIYEEVISGESLYTRPQMLKLLEDIENGLYEAVLCMDIDRLGRGAMSDQGIILETMKNENVKIITPRKIYDLNNELDEEYTEFETFMARRELKVIKRRMQRGKTKTVEDGGHVTTPPYGYNRVYIDKKPTLEINETEAHFVRMIFDLYVNQGAGALKIAETITSLGAVPHIGKAFSKNSISYILKNPVYTGKIVWNRQKRVRKGQKDNVKIINLNNPASSIITTEGLHPAIIDGDTFDRAQKVRELRTKPPYNKGVLRNPLAGIVVCKVCGLNLRMAPFEKDSATKCLLCQTKGCVKATRFDRVENAILQGIQRNLESLKLSITLNNTDKDLIQIRKTLDIVDKELLTVEQQKDKLHDLLEQGVYDADTFMKRLYMLNEKYDNLKNSKSLLDSKLNKFSDVNMNTAINKVENTLQAYYKADVKRKNELLKSIVSRVSYYKDKSWAPDQFELEIYLKDINAEY